MKVQDLDILRPESKFITIGGKKIDVSFVPCGITFDIDMIMDELTQLDTEKTLGSKDEIKKANGNIEAIKKIKEESLNEIKKGLDLSIKLCSTFCAYKYPELDEQWFRENIDANQIKAFTSAISEALRNAYLGIESTPKNSKAAKKKTP